MKDNNNYDPLLKVNIPLKNNEFTGSIYNEKGELMSIHDIEKGCEVEPVVQNTGVYFIGSEFGTSWKLVELKVYEKYKISGYSFVSED